jgi:hypothetical protein
VVPADGGWGRSNESKFKRLLFRLLFATLIRSLATLFLLMVETTDGLAGGGGALVAQSGDNWWQGISMK